MNEELGELKKELSFGLVTGKDVDRIVEMIFSKGYTAGVRDQKKINYRLKFKYNILLNWIDTQLSTFSSYTLRQEYKTILDGILDLKDVFVAENNLHSAYKPNKPFELEIEGEKVVFDVKQDLSYLLVDVVGNFVASEDARLALAKDRKDQNVNQNKN